MIFHHRLSPEDTEQSEMQEPSKRNPVLLVREIEACVGESSEMDNKPCKVHLNAVKVG